MPKSNSNKTLVILDSNAIIHRAFHALPPLTDKNGFQTNAVYGYFSVLFKVLQELKPDFLVATFDMAGPTFRHKQFAQYKAKRVKAPQELYDQIPVVKEGLEAFNVPIFGVEGAEADDLMGTLAKIAKSYDSITKVILVTGDMDAMQLVDDQTFVFMLKKGISDTAIFDSQAVSTKYGFSPTQVVDFKGLKGDSSDNIPGVPGIGDKTALKLIEKFGDLETLYQYLDSVESYEQLGVEEQKIFGKKMFENLKNFREQAFFSKDLATIKTDVEMNINWQEGELKDFDEKKVGEFLAKYQFGSLKERFDKVFDNNEEQQNTKTPTKSTGSLFDMSTTKPKKAEVEETTLLDWDDVRKHHSHTIDFGKRCFVFQVEDKFVLLNDNGDIQYQNSFLDLKKRLLGFDGLKIGYDLKELLVDLDIKKVDRDWFDIKIAGYLLSPGERSYDWQRIRDKYLRVAVSEKFPWDGMVKVTDLLQKLLIEKNLEYVFWEIEMKLMPVLGYMEKFGMFVEVDYLEKLSTEMQSEIEKLQKEIFGITKKEFNLNSPKQLGEILFEEGGVLGEKTLKIKKTKGGQLSTSAEVLESLQGTHPIIDFILQYRELSKLKNTYVDVLPTLADPAGRIHTTFEQTGTATGRLSSNNPNLQNIPGHSEWGKKVKSGFVAPQGKLLVICDYSQIELRLAAHLSEDKNLLEIFRSGQDIHRATASNMFGVRAEQVTSEMRHSAKAINFGILYGMGAVSLAKNLHISKTEAQKYLVKYKETYPELIRFLEVLKEQGRTTKEARTIFGRLRDLREYSLKDPRAKSALERIAMNMPLQGLQADIVKLSMIKVFDEVCDGKQVVMVMQVHDELVFEVDIDLAEKVSQKVKYIMESVFPAKIPLPVETVISNKWEK